MAVMIDPEKSSVLRAAPRLMQILRVLVSDTSSWASCSARAIGRRLKRYGKPSRNSG